MIKTRGTQLKPDCSGLLAHLLASWAVLLQSPQGTGRIMLEMGRFPQILHPDPGGGVALPVGNGLANSTGWEKGRWVILGLGDAAENQILSMEKHCPGV